MPGEREKFVVGIAGWSYRDWEDVAYPKDEKDKLRYLSKFVDLVEINTSFYRPVSANMAQKWLRSVSHNPNFVFSAKLWQRFTHVYDEPYTRPEVEEFKQGLEPLMDAGKFGALLMQFPFYFRNSQEARDLVTKLSDDFAEYPKVIEVRDRSWNNLESFDFFRQNQLSVANLDMPRARDGFDKPVASTGEIGYLRIHGRNYDAWFKKGAGRDEKYDYLYSEEEVDELMRRAEDIAEKALKTFAIFNNHFKAKALVNSLQIISRQLKRKVPVPWMLIDFFPELEKIAQPRPKETLF